MRNIDMQKKIGQLFVFGFNGKIATPEIKKLIRERHLGGIILFGRNVGTPKELLELTTDLQRVAKEAGYKYPLLICTDQENGAVRRLGGGATIFPGAMLIGATCNPDNAYTIGNQTGIELKALGINWNLSPVLDVNNNALNPVIGIRSFGESPNEVAKFGKKMMKGMQESGIITTLKHFPGHGDTSVDSHLDLPVILHDLKRLDNVELKPFKACIDGGADVVMTAHVYFPAIEDRYGIPATISKKVITGLLREKLQFNGVVTTDCMEMKAISNGIGTPRGAIEALNAGVDLIMVSHTYPTQVATLNAILNAVESNEIQEQVIDDAFNRVLALKEKYLSWDDVALDGNIVVPDVVGCEEHRESAAEVYRNGITIVKNEHNLLPLSTSSDKRVLVVYPTNSYATLVEDKRYATFSIGESIQQIHSTADIYEFSSPPTVEEIESIMSKVKNYDTVIAATISATPGSSQVTLINKLCESGVPVVVVATRNPYDFNFLPTIQAYICTYEFTAPALSMAGRAIYGKEHVMGKLPVGIL